MSKTMDKEYIYVRESAIQSIISDIFTFGMFIGLMTLNFTYWGGKWYTTIFIMALWLGTVMSRTSARIHKFHTAQEVIDYLKENQ